MSEALGSLRLNTVKKASVICERAPCGQDFDFDFDFDADADADATVAGALGAPATSRSVTTANAAVSRAERRIRTARIESADRREALRAEAGSVRVLTDEVTDRGAGDQPDALLLVEDGIPGEAQPEARARRTRDRARDASEVVRERGRGLAVARGRELEDLGRGVAGGLTCGRRRRRTLVRDRRQLGGVLDVGHLLGGRRAAEVGVERLRDVRHEVLVLLAIGDLLRRGGAGRTGRHAHARARNRHEYQ